MQVVFVLEEVFIDFVLEKLSDIGEDGVFEDMVEVGVWVGLGGKKEVLFSKIVLDGKLVKVFFVLISFVIKVKENDLFFLEKNCVKLDDDSDDDEESKEG